MAAWAIANDFYCGRIPACLKNKRERHTGNANKGIIRELKNGNTPFFMLVWLGGEAVSALL